MSTNFLNPEQTFFAPRHMKKRTFSFESLEKIKGRAKLTNQRELRHQSEQRHLLSKSMFKYFIQKIFPKFINSASLSVPASTLEKYFQLYDQVLCLWPNGLGMETLSSGLLLLSCGHNICLGHGITQSIKYLLSNQTTNGIIRLGLYCIPYYLS